MSLGYLISVLVVAAMVASALWPRPTHGPHATPTFVLGTMASEIPFMLTWYLLLITWAALDNRELELESLAGAVSAGVAALAVVGLLVIIGQSLRAMPTLDTALDATLGTVLRTLEAEPQEADSVDARPLVSKIAFGVGPTRDVG